MPIDSSIIALAALAITCSAHATVFYSIDIDTDELVSIDPATGAVTVIGPLGYDAGDIDLTVHDGRLYGLNSLFQERVELLEIDTVTGTAAAPIEVTNGGAAILNAESIASLCGDLVIGFNDPATAANPAFSNALGTIDSNGTVTSFVTFSSTVDFDGLSADATGLEFRSIDAQGPGVPVLLNVGDRTPPTVILIDEFTPGDGTSDILFHGSSLYMIAFSVQTLYRIDPTTGELLEAIMLDREGRYFGLATGDPGRCPGDLDRNGMVGFFDLTALLSQWGPCSECPCPGDLDSSGSVGFNDLTMQLNAWGACQLP